MGRKRGREEEEAGGVEEEKKKREEKPWKNGVVRLDEKENTRKVESL